MNYRYYTCTDELSGVQRPNFSNQTLILSLRLSLPLSLFSPRLSFRPPVIPLITQTCCTTVDGAVRIDEQPILRGGAGRAVRGTRTYGYRLKPDLLFVRFNSCRYLSTERATIERSRTARSWPDFLRRQWRPQQARRQRTIGS